MLLAGVILKLAIYALIRLVIPSLSDATVLYTPVAYLICAVTIIYTSLITLRQSDLKVIVAYSSISHMAVCILGILSNSLTGISTYKDEDLYKENALLVSETRKLKQFIEFMDTSFSDMYQKWRADKEEKEKLQKMVDKMNKVKLDDTPRPKTWKTNTIKTNDDDSTEKLLNFL